MMSKSTISDVSIINDELYNCCQREYFLQAKDILNQYKCINIIYENGDCLHFAAKYKNTVMMEALLKYFYEVQLPQIDNKYLRKDTENKLKEIIEEVKDSWVITEEIEKVINKHLTLEGVTDNSSDENLNDPIESFDPYKHFSNVSTQESTPEKELSGNLDTDAICFVE